MTTCTARRHGTASARRRHGCSCPTAVDAERLRNRRTYERRAYVRGSATTIRAPRTGIDPIAVDRAVSGSRPDVMTLPEIWAAIDRLDAHGANAREIATRLRITMRTVQRQRARRRTGGAR